MVKVTSESAENDATTQDAENLINVTQVITTLLTPAVAYGVNQVNSTALSLKNRFENLISAEPDVRADVAKKDKKFIANIMNEQYKNNLRNRCKLEAALNFTGFNIKIIADAVKADMIPPDGLASFGVYHPLNNRISLEQGIHKENPKIVAQHLSHEETHLVNAYDNYLQNRCADKEKIIACSVVFGLFPNGAKEEFSQSDQDDCTRVRKLFDKDLNRIFKLNAARQKSALQRTAKETKALNKLGKMLIASNYQHTWEKSITPSQEVLLPMVAHYKYLPLLEKYVVADEIYYTNGMYIHEFILKDNGYVIVTYTDVNDFSPENLIKDVLINLSKRFQNVKSSKDLSSHPQELLASMEEVLAPYSKKVSKSGKSLLEFLLPKMADHYEKRASAAHRECLRRG